MLRRRSSGRLPYERPQLQTRSLASWQSLGRLDRRRSANNDSRASPHGMKVTLKTCGRLRTSRTGHRPFSLVLFLLESTEGAMSPWLRHFVVAVVLGAAGLVLSLGLIGTAAAQGPF